MKFNLYQAMVYCMVLLVIFYIVVFLVAAFTVAVTDPMFLGGRPVATGVKEIPCRYKGV